MDFRFCNKIENQPDRYRQPDENAYNEVAIDSPQSHGGGKPAFCLQESNLIINQDYIAAALEKIEILNKLQ